MKLKHRSAAVLFSYALSLKTFQGNLSSGRHEKLLPSGRIIPQEKSAMLQFSLLPYFPSPTRGIFRLENCTRIWWLRPVLRRILTSEKPSFLSITLYSSFALLTPLRSRFTTKLLFFLESLKSKSSNSPLSASGVP